MLRKGNLIVVDVVFGVQVLAVSGILNITCGFTKCPHIVDKAFDS